MESEPDTDAGSSARQTEPMIKVQNARDTNDDVAACGIGRFKPSALQKCASVGAFTGVYSFSVLLTSTLTAYVNSQVTTLERQFGFSSSQTGLIMAGNEVGFLVVVLFVSYIASQVHIPRSLGYLTILFGVSGIICALPHFFFGAPSHGSDASAVNVSHMTSLRTSMFVGQLCDGVHENTSALCDVMEQKASVSGATSHVTDRARANAGVAMVIIFIGMVIQGVAKAPRAPFSTAFIDDNVEKTKTGFYVGIMLSASQIGPALAYGFGGIFAKIYVTLEETNLRPRHPKWIGAWWLGYFTFGLAACVFGVFLFCFPRRIRKGSTPAQKTQRPRPLTTKPSRAIRSYIKAAVVLCGAVPGMFLGGYVTKRFKMSPMACLKFGCVVHLLYTLFTAVQLAFKCDQPDLYNSPGPRAISNESMSGCYDDCACDDYDFFPICDGDGRTFFSPCHAGCSGNIGNIYVNCTCIPATSASAGMCDYSCAIFYPFIGVMALFAASATLFVVPKVIVFIRSVEHTDRALALGLVSFMNSMTGWMLAPIVFGKLIDDACIQWENGEDSFTGSGACRLYDNDVFRWKLIGYQAVINFASFLCMVLGLVAAVVGKKFDKTDPAENGKDEVDFMSVNASEETML